MPLSSQRTSAFRQSPSSGLFVPAHVKLSGRARWQVLDERGVPEIPRNPGGFAIGPIEGVEQPNLITNLGMDAIADTTVLSNSASDHIRAFLAVGTGSTAPAVTDIALDNEVETRTSSDGGFGIASPEELDTMANVWRYSVGQVRVRSMTANRNLTEYGLSTLITQPNGLNIRELLRDGGGTPVTISILSGKSLRLDHTLVVEAPAPAAGTVGVINIEKYDVGGALVSTTPYDVTYGGTMESTVINYSQLFLAWEPSGENSAAASHGLNYLSSAFTYARTGTVNVNGALNAVPQAYTPGSYERVKSNTFAPASANGAWHGFFLGHGATSGTDGQWVCVFDTPLTYTKLDTDQITFGFKCSWARA